MKSLAVSLLISLVGAVAIADVCQDFPDRLECNGRENICQRNPTAPQCGGNPGGNNGGDNGGNRGGGNPGGGNPGGGSPGGDANDCRNFPHRAGC